MITIDVDCSTCGISDGCERVWKNPDAPVTCVSRTPPKKTNGDRIRAMTDEDLADFLQDVTLYGGWLDWLKKEAQDDRLCSTDRRSEV